MQPHMYTANEKNSGTTVNTQSEHCVLVFHVYHIQGRYIQCTYSLCLYFQLSASKIVLGSVKVGVNHVKKDLKVHLIVAVSYIQTICS